MTISRLQFIENFAAGSDHVFVNLTGISAGSFVVAQMAWDASVDFSSCTFDGALTDCGFGTQLDFTSIAKARWGAFFAPAAGTTTGLLTLTGTAPYVFLALYEIGGYASPAWDQVAFNTWAGGGSTVNISIGPTGTLSQAVELAIAWITNEGGPSHHGAGWSATAPDGADDANAQGGWFYESQITSTTAAVTGTGTTAFNTDSGVGFVGTFKDLGGGGGPAIDSSYGRTLFRSRNQPWTW